MAGRTKTKNPARLARRDANRRQFAQATKAVERQLNPLVTPPARHEPSDEEILAVLNAVATGRTLRGKCRELGISESTVRMQIGRDEQLNRMFVIARQAQAHAFAELNLEDLDALDTIDTTADGASVELGIARHKFDVRKWTMGKYHVGAYGEKVEVSHVTKTPVEQAVEGEDAERLMRKYTDQLRIAGPKS